MFYYLSLNVAPIELNIELGRMKRSYIYEQAYWDPQETEADLLFMLSTYVIWIFKMNPNTVASGHSNKENVNDLLTNNVNNTKIVWTKYGDGSNRQTGGL